MRGCFLGMCLKHLKEAGVPGGRGLEALSDMRLEGHPGRAGERVPKV